MMMKHPSFVLCSSCSSLVTPQDISLKGGKDARAALNADFQMVTTTHGGQEAKAALAMMAATVPEDQELDLDVSENRKMM